MRAVSRQASLSVLLLAVLISIDIAQAEAELWIQESNSSSTNGKPLQMRFEELVREESYSVARIEYVSGASVPSIMFSIQGMYSIAKLRGSAYFVFLDEWRDDDGHTLYKIGFADSLEEAERQKALRKTPPPDGTIVIMPVSDYDVLWGNKW